MTKRRKTPASRKPNKPKKRVIEAEKKKKRPAAKKPIAKPASKVKTAKKTPISRKKKTSHMTRTPKPSKKRLTAKQRKNRERALKGWETRRKFQNLLPPTPQVESIVLDKVLPETTKAPLPVKELLEQLSQYRFDGSIAKEPSILRHFGDKTVDMLDKLWRSQRPTEQGYYAMTQAEIAETPEFRYTAIDIAQEFGVQLKEVYTLFFST